MCVSRIFLGIVCPPRVIIDGIITIIRIRVNTDDVRKEGEKVTYYDE